MRKLKLTLGRLRDASLDIPLMRRIMNVGIPAAVEMAFMRGAQLAFARLVASLGTTAIAAHQIALNTESISFQPGWGISMAGAALVGQGLGAGKPKLAEIRVQGSPDRRCHHGGFGSGFVHCPRVLRKAVYTG